MVMQLHDLTPPVSPLERREFAPHRQVVDSLAPSDTLSVLLLCDDHPGHANTVLDHIEALTASSVHDVRRFNPCGLKSSRFLDLREFDVLVLHYSLVIVSNHYLSPDFREQIRQFKGLKIQFLQDEYRWVDAITAMMRDLGIHVLFTLLPPKSISKVYDDVRLPGVRKITALAGYVPDNLLGRRVPPIGSRPIEIGYRGRELPFWLGRLAQEKMLIAKGVLARAPQYNLRCDIAWKEEDRIYGPRWIEFLSSCRATLGTESGASLTDFDGQIEQQTKAYLAEAPSATFEEVSHAVFGSYDGAVPITAISPRVFEAAALRTALILFPGEYSGIIQPWEHYIPLAKDFSNMDAVVEKLRDLAFLEAMTQRAYKDLIASGRYSQRALTAAFDNVVSTYGTSVGKRRKVCYRLASLERPYAVTVAKTRDALRPYLLIPQNLFKGLLAIMLMLGAKPGWQVLWAYIRGDDLRQAVRLSELMRDVLKLAVVGQVSKGRPSASGFEIQAKLHSERRSLVLLSQPLSQGQKPSACRFLQIDGDQQVNTMVWNHAAVGGSVCYAICPGIRILVCVGDYDLHSFEGLLQLMRCRPALAWGLCHHLVQG